MNPAEPDPRPRGAPHAASAVTAVSAASPLADPVGAGLRRRRLFGLDLVDEPDLEPVLAAVLGSPTADRPTGGASGDRADGGGAVIDLRPGPADALPVLVTPNVDILVHLADHPDSTEAEVFRRAAYVLPDGMPLVAASRLLRRPLRARLPGSGLFEELWPRLLARRSPVVLLCASDEIVHRLDPGRDEVRFVVPPWFDARTPSEVDGVVDLVLAACDDCRPGHVLLGLGNPKDAVVAARMLERWPDPFGPRPLVLGLGGSFAMVAGLKRRAPRWVQRIGMEWFYRFAQEPRRLFHRYFVQDLGFLPIVVAEARRIRRER